MIWRKKKRSGTKAVQMDNFRSLLGIKRMIKSQMHGQLSGVTKGVDKKIDEGVVR